MSTQPPPPPPPNPPIGPDPTGRKGYNSTPPGSGSSFTHSSAHHLGHEGHKGVSATNDPTPHAIPGVPSPDGRRGYNTGAPSGTTPAQPHVLHPQPDGRRGYNADNNPTPTPAQPQILHPQPDGRKGYNQGTPTHGGHSHEEPHKAADPAHHAKTSNQLH